MYLMEPIEQNVAPRQDCKGRPCIGHTRVLVMREKPLPVRPLAAHRSMLLPAQPPGSAPYSELGISTVQEEPKKPRITVPQGRPGHVAQAAPWRN
jgi:hypothetical protein